MSRRLRSGALETDGRQHERGPEEEAADAGRDESGVVHDVERHDRGGVARELQVEVAVGAVACRAMEARRVAHQVL